MTNPNHKLEAARDPARNENGQKRASMIKQTTVLVALLAGSIGAFDARADPTSGYQGMAISVIKAERHCFKDVIQVSGVLVPKVEIQVRAERDGSQVSQVLVEPGDTVGAGQVLARLIQTGAPNAPVTVIKSPVSGVAIEISAPVGSYVSPTSPNPMFRIVVDGELMLKGQILASTLPKLKIDQVASIEIMGIGHLAGRVGAIDNSVDAMTQLGSVRIDLASDPRLRSGAFGRAEIQAGESCDITVPLSAMLYGTEGAVVQVVRGDHVETRRVTVGSLSRGFVQIRDGLDEGDVVVGRAGGFLREGDRVRPFAMEADANR